MATSSAISAATKSIESLLDGCFAALHAADDEAFVGDSPPSAQVVRTEDFASATDGVHPLIQGSTVSILCHRVEVNRETRPPWSGVGHRDGGVHLPVDLHLLLTAWGTNADAELRMIGATMMCLEQHPVLSGPLLDPAGGWSSADAIYLTVQDLDAEDILRTFDALPASFRLSIAYCARIAVIEAPPVDLAPDVSTVVRGLVPSSVPLP